MQWQLDFWTSDFSYFKNVSKFIILRGYCTPDQFFDCLCIFLKKLHHIGNKKGMFLVGDNPGNLITALEFY